MVVQLIWSLNGHIASEGRWQLSDYRDRRLHQISFRGGIPRTVDPAYTKADLNGAEIGDDLPVADHVR
jgi:hypothetical protein